MMDALVNTKMNWASQTYPNSIEDNNETLLLNNILENVNKHNKFMHVTI